MPAGGKRRLIRGEGLVTRISNDYEPQLPVVGDDVPGPAAITQLGAVRPLKTVDQRAMAVGDGFRLLCSDSDDSDDDVLSVGPILLPHWVGQEEMSGLWNPGPRRTAMRRVVCG